MEQIMPLIKQKIRILLDKNKQVVTSFSTSLLIVYLLLLILDITGITRTSAFLNLYALCIIVSIIFVTANLAYKDKHEMLKYAFLASLLLTTLSLLKFNPLGFLAKYSTHFVILTAVFGLITFYHNRKWVENNLEREKIEEESAEYKRYREFDKKFPFLAWLNLNYGASDNFKRRRWLGGVFRILISPFVWLARLPYRFVRWCYGEGWIFSILLIAIFALFFFSKFPYFETALTTDEGLKYSAHVGAAIQMQEHRNPFFVQYLYAVDPVNNPSGVRTEFGPFPYLEWGFLLTNTLFKTLSVEFNTRLFLSVIGIIFLFFVYAVFKKIISKEYSLMVTYLLSINFIFAFITFIPSQDLFALLFMFVSIYYLLMFKKKNEIKSLIISGMFFGLGAISKQSLFIWYGPISFLIILIINEHKIREFIRSYLIFTIFNFLIILNFFLGFRYLPSSPVRSCVISALFILITIKAYYFCIKKGDLINETLERIYKKKYLSFGLFLALITSLALIFLVGAYNLLGEFITDKYLLFNAGVYTYIINQIKANLNFFVWAAFLPGLFLSILVKKINLKYLWAFIIGSGIYLVVASKSIFFHRYYLFIMTFTMILFSALLVFYFLKPVGKKVKLICLLAIIFLTLSPALTSIGKEFSVEQKQIILLTEYLKENMAPSDLYMDEGYVVYPSLKLRIGRVSQIDFLENPDVLNSINEIGFNRTMSKYHIKYITTNRNQLRYDRLINIFASDKNLQSAIYRRTDIVFERLYGRDYFSDRDLRNELMNELKINEKFVLEKQFGAYKIYSFRD
jgi:hypothetical protein